MATRQEAREALMLASAIQQDVDQILQKECPLTARERKILSLVASGLEQPQIAQRLQISRLTVKNHLARVRAQLNTPTTTRAVVIALQHGWIEFPKERA